ncbi:MAG: alpha/beta fold hydrolase [Pseudomonadota bacterium]
MHDHERYEKAHAGTGARTAPEMKARDEDEKKEDLAGLPLVWLHGWGMSAAIWRAVPAFARYDSLALDLPGHGNAAWNDALGADITLWAQEMLARAPQRAIWLGWSLGGQVALEAARLAPQRVAALGLVASNPCFVARSDWPCAMSAAAFAQFEAGLQQDHAQTVRRFLALQTLGAADARQTRLMLEQAVADAAESDERALHAGLRLLRDADQRAALSGLSMPVALLLGGMDRIVPPCALAACLQLQASAWTACMQTAGHAPFLYAQEKKNELEAMLAWLQGMTGVQE